MTIPATRRQVLAQWLCRAEDADPLLDAGPEPRRRHARQRQLPRHRSELGHGHRVLQLAQRQDRQKVSTPNRSRMGKGRARNRPASLPWGNNIDNTYANFVGAQKYDTVQIVGYYDGSKRGDFQTNNGASPYGAYDMAGNLMEWCQDWYGRNYYSVSPRKNPQGPKAGSFRVLRGGAFFFEPQDARSYARSTGWPSLQSFRMIGFRAARDQ